MSASKIKCSCCEAEFGIKFEAVTCVRCGESFCQGHIVPREHLILENTVELNMGPRSGLCIQCLFTLWEKSDEHLKIPTGIIGRLKATAAKIQRSTAIFLDPRKSPTEVIKLRPDALDKLINERAWAVFKHQKEISSADIARDLKLFARLVAVDTRRKHALDFTLKDIYRFIDYMKTHPKLPDWLHSISWSTIESTQMGFALFLDICHITSTAMALSNPATGIPLATYHVSDRLIDQKTGDGLALNAYKNIKESLGININPRMALLTYLSGILILQLYRRPPNSTT